jgi:hypothetical protein
MEGGQEYHPQIEKVLFWRKRLGILSRLKFMWSLLGKIYPTRRKDDRIRFLKCLHLKYSV